MNRKTFLILFSLAMVACNQENDLRPTDDKPTSHVNIVATQSSPYLKLYQSESEMIAHLVYTSSNGVQFGMADMILCGLHTTLTERLAGHWNSNQTQQKHIGTSMICPAGCSVPVTN